MGVDKQRLGIERLEGRFVPASFTEFAIPTANAYPGAIITVESDLWFLETGTTAIGKITATGTITEYYGLSIDPSNNPDALTLGPDGNLWLLEGSGDNGLVAKVSTSGVVLGEYPLGRMPNGIAAGPDGNLWIAEGGEGDGGGWVARMTTAGVITATIPTTDFPMGITAGTDGKLWFTEVPSNALSDPLYIGNIDPNSGSPILTEYNTFQPVTSLSITQGSDGNYWFPEDQFDDDPVGQITTTGMVNTYYDGSPPNNLPDGLITITPGPDGNLWLAEAGGDNIDSVTTSGNWVEQLRDPTSGGTPWGIVTGPDNKVWFTEMSGNKIARLDSLDGSGGGVGGPAIVQPHSPDSFVDLTPGAAPYVSTSTGTATSLVATRTQPIDSGGPSTSPPAGTGADAFHAFQTSVHQFVTADPRAVYTRIPSLGEDAAPPGDTLVLGTLS